MILLSLALVVASMGTLVGGLATSSDPLVWTSLGAGLLAVAFVAGSVARRRTRLLTSVGVSGSPSLPTSPAAPRADAVSPGGPTTAAPVTGGVFPDDRLPAGPRPPADTTGEVTAADVTGVAPESDTPAAHDTPSNHDVPGRPPDVVPNVTAAFQQVDAALNSSALPAHAMGRAEQLSEPSAEPPLEDVPIRDALRVAQLSDPVTVCDGHPRYHLDGCPTLDGAADRTELAVSAARRSGFTPCGVCNPDRALLARSRRPD